MTKEFPKANHSEQKCLEITKNNHRNVFLAFRELKDKYQDRVTFVGGFDNQNVFDRVGVTEEEIRAEVVRAYSELAPGGSFVAFPLTVTFDFVPTFIDEHFKQAFRFGIQ